MKKIKKTTFFERLSHVATSFSGTTSAFIIALGIILVWLLTGPVFGFSDTWQLVINTGTTIITFLIVFLIQRMQNKDSQAIHIKLNELIASQEGPSNRLIDVEDITEEELKTLASYFWKLSIIAKKEVNLSKSHSIEEAKELHASKYGKLLFPPHRNLGGRFGRHRVFFRHYIRHRCFYLPAGFGWRSFRFVGYGR